MSKHVKIRDYTQFQNNITTPPRVTCRTKWQCVCIHNIPTCSHLVTLYWHVAMSPGLSDEGWPLSSAIIQPHMFLMLTLILTLILTLTWPDTVLCPCSSVCHSCPETAVATLGSTASVSRPGPPDHMLDSLHTNARSRCQNEKYAFHIWSTCSAFFSYRYQETNKVFFEGAPPVNS